MRECECSVQRHQQKCTPIYAATILTCRYILVLRKSRVEVAKTRKHLYFRRNAIQRRIIETTFARRRQQLLSRCLTSITSALEASTQAVSPLLIVDMVHAPCLGRLRVKVHCQSRPGVREIEHPTPRRSMAYKYTEFHMNVHVEWSA